MTQGVLRNRLVGMVESVGATPGDTADIRLQKSLLVSIAGMIIVAAFIWSAIYTIFGEPGPALIPFSYAVFSSLSIATFAVTRRYGFFRLSQLFLIIVLPFLLMVSLGGFAAGSSVILWSLLCPLGALMFANRRQAIIWLVLYLALLGVSGILEFTLDGFNDLSREIIVMFFALNLTGVSVIIFILFAYFSKQKDDTLELLEVEREKSDNLLLNVLPSNIADELKENGRVTARRFDAVSVMFADIVGSTQLTTQLSPEQLIETLNRIFTEFDRIADKYGAEKIRTVGDNYFAATGVPVPSDTHAADMANMALEMLAFMNKLNASGETEVQFRIGLNTGPVIAGVVGQRKFHYDIWGDAVNTASRMESHGIPGKIQMTQDMKALLEDDFVCTLRGNVDVKGVGETETWLLEGVREHARR